MIKRIANTYKFYLERLIFRGAHYQLLVIGILIILVSLIAGAIVIVVPDFKWVGEAVWWAFLRLTDPGYLGDDKGLLLRTVSTILTVLGYVLFMGALIAIMTQWLHGTMKKLESGLTPITQNDHILILGWTNRTPTIVQELILSEGRVKRFLRRIGASRLHVVIQAEEVSPALAHELHEELGSRWNPKQITFRSGSPLRIEHLRRVDFMNASRIILPGADFASEGSELVDTRTIKALLSISNYGNLQSDRSLPLVVAEMFDARKIPIAKAAYRGEVEIISSDSVIGRLIAQNVRHQGLSYVYSELLTHGDGNEVYIRECPQFNGEKLQNIAGAFPNAILLGVLRRKDKTFIPILNPPDGFEAQNGDRMVFTARSYRDTEPVEDFKPESLERGSRIEVNNGHDRKRILIMGWNQKIPALVQEFDSYENESFEIDILSLIEVARREEYMSRYDLNLRNVTLHHLFGDYTAPSDLRRINPASYDNVVLVCNSWLESNEESDARTILGYMLLREMLPKDPHDTEILIELMDPENEKLFEQRKGEVLISPLILSHILAHVALRRDLNVVFEELFTVGGAEIYFRPAAGYEVTRREITFREIEKIVSLQGEIALGVRSSERSEDKTGGISLNPGRDSVWKLREPDEVVVLTTYV